MDSHRAAFVAEAEEGITDLNNALLALEADPEDGEAMDDVFRVAHTLKGNAAAIGYEDVSAFGHALEDGLDVVRQGDREVTPELMDLLFEGVDTVEAMVSEIAETGEVTTDPSDLESRLREMEARGSAGEADDRGSDDGVDTGDEDLPAEARDLALDPDVAPGADVGTIVHADVTIGDTQMPGVDAAFVLQQVDDAFEAAVTEPGRDRLEDGEYEKGFDVFVAADDAETVAAEIDGLSQVEGVDVTRVNVPDDRETADVPDGQATIDDTDDREAADDTDESVTGSESEDSTDRKEISSIRIDVDQVDELYGLVEQLVTSRIKLRRELEAADVESESLDELDKLASSLQDTAMDMRLIPFSQVSDPFPRLIRDVARECDKQVRFEVTGDDVELDRTILTEMRDPLVHVLRNAVDHGIEPPEEREATGKDPTGTVELVASRDRDHVVIEVRDDGGGLDPDALREKTIEEGVATRTELDAMDDEEVYDLVFHPGFSTAEEVTDVSGRGVGMDVVRTTARNLDGSVSVDSDPGEGTTVRFRIPVTVAIVKVMFVDVGGTEYGIPIKSIAEVGRADHIEEVHGREVVRHKGDLYDVVRLRDRLAEGPSVSDGPDDADGTGGTDEQSTMSDGGVDSEADGASTTSTDGTQVASSDGMLVRIREETRQVAFHCDAVLDQEEVVVKPLDGPLSGTPGLSGTAVLGDGDVVAVLDVVSL